MATLTGTPGPDTIQGTPDDDIISTGGSDDLVSGEGGNDSIAGGAGNDTLFGDAGVGTAPGLDASPITLDIANIEAQTGNNTQEGDFAIYNNVAQLADGTQISGRLVLVDRSSPDLNVDLTGGRGFEILLNGRPEGSDAQGGETASFRLEFFDPTTGEPVALNSVATFNDIDRTRVGNQESVTINTDSFSAFATSADTSLAISTGNGTITAAGTEQNGANDQDAFFSAQFEDREFIEFTLETRTTQSGFTLSGDLIQEPIVTAIEGGDDTIDGGSGQDVIIGQGGNDSLLGRDGDDDLSGGEGDDFIDGGTGQDTIDGGAGDDTLVGGDGDDLITAGDGIDQLSGGQGQDTLLGGAGADTLIGGEGDDSLSGGDGEDLLILDENSDTADGGLNSDLFSVTGIGNHVIVGGEDPDGQDIDVINLNGLDANIISTGDESGIIELLDADGNVGGRIQFSEIEEVIICFTPGTLVATLRGQVPIEQLAVGDKVVTRDNGAQELRWIGQRDLGSSDLLATPAHLPIRIKANALGAGKPERDMMVSPNHRMLIVSEMSEVMFGDREVLVAAKHLTDMEGVDICPVDSVSYFHLMFDSHEVILADGVWTESFQPGEYSMAGILNPQREEIQSLFPELLDIAGPEVRFPAARRLLRAHEAHVLAVGSKGERVL